MKRNFFQTPIGQFAGFVVFFLTLANGTVISAAEPKVFLENATIVGVNNTLSLSRVPVRATNGTIMYKDVFMLFEVDEAGKLILDKASVSIGNSPPLKTGTFKPGLYTDPYNVCQETCTVGSPGVGGGGRVATSLSGYALDANWISGPIAGHPYEALLKQAGITGTSMTWGIVGRAFWNYTPDWHAGDIIGAVQTGNQISLTNFGNKNIPKSALVFTLCTNC